MEQIWYENGLCKIFAKSRCIKEIVAGKYDKSLCDMFKMRNFLRLFIFCGKYVNLLCEITSFFKLFSFVICIGKLVNCK